MKSITIALVCFLAACQQTESSLTPKYIENENILTPTTVLQIASKNPNLPLSVIRSYIVGHIEAEERQAERDLNDIDSLRDQIHKLKDENEKLQLIIQFLFYLQRDGFQMVKITALIYPTLIS